MTTRLRPTSPDDTPALATLIVSQREHLVPWEPARPESWFTAEGQREVLEQADADRAAGRSHAFIITDGSGALFGRLNLASVVRGAGQFCSLGYWLAREQTGRGVATTAVKQALRIAFDHLNPDQSGGWPNGGAPTRDVWEQWAHRRNELLLAVVAIRAYEAEIPTSVRKEEEGVYVGYRAAPSTSCTTDTNATASWWPPRRTPSAPPQAVWRAKCAGLTPGPATASRGSWTSTTSSR